ncbi:MAG: substrate-binding domain-containing protein [Lachnospiraceae bacterium]|nr:substrate-binding domain-containing protein [Lachnospiraceae bacterium]
MKRKFVSALVCAAMVATMAVGCGGGNTETNAPASDAGTEAPAETEAPTETEAPDAGADAEAPATGGETISIGIINNDPNESGYRTANVRNLEETFSEANGYATQTFYGKENDKQVEAAQKMIQDGVDYLLISAADVSGWDTVLQDAQDAGVRVLLYDRIVNASEDLYEAGVVSDMAKEGETAVAWLEKQGLEKYEIIHLQGQMGAAAQVGRSEALTAAAEEKGWTLVTQQTAEWNAEKAQQIVQSVIDSGKSFNVIYAENDDMAKGAVAALDKANISHGVDGDVIIMGFDCNKWALEELKAGNWNYDGQCNPFQGEKLAELIKKIESGETLSEKLIYMEEKGFDAKEITQEDIDKFGI